MYIKSITISGFRSYPETKSNALVDLSSGHNVIVGRNGCGKTNILNAIQFVLSDEYNGLDSQQRHQLINEGTSKRLLMAYVDVVIDNSDRRMPIELDEIVFRRQIGLKKNQYFMNNRLIKHSEIAQLLETAGFSRSNPYYIVKQGKVNELATASDNYRLQVMREVAGTRIYDQKKAESLKVLNETGLKSRQIDTYLESLKQKFVNLQTECKDLDEFQKWDKRRRLLDYMITNEESENMKTQKIKLEDKLEKEEEVLREKRSKLQELQRKSKDLDKTLKTMSSVVEAIRKEMNDINKNIDELNERKVKIESEMNDFNEKIKFNSETDEEINRELSKIKLLIDSKKKRLVLVNAKYEEYKKKENHLFCELKAKQSRKVELYAKQKRKEKFSTVQERDRWIRSELSKLNKEIETNEKRVEELKSEQFRIIVETDQLEDQKKQLSSEEENLLKSLQNEREEFCKLKNQIKQMENKRSELWDSENSEKQNELKYSEEKAKMESRLTKFSGTSAIIGRQSVRRVLDIFEQRASNSSEDECRFRLLIDGYYGQVIDCFSFDQNLTKAIEVTTKSKLFHHIVVSDKIGTKIIKEVNVNHMLGDITFIAINKLNVKPVRFPQLGNDAKPLIDLIKYDIKYEKVMKFLFGRILLCRNLEVATHFSRTAKLDCVTMDGDFVSHKGLMTGGYMSGNTRIEMFNIWFKLFNKLESIRKNISEYSGLKEANEKKLTLAQNTVTSLDIKQNKTKHKLEDLKISKLKIRDKLFDLKHKSDSIARSIVGMESTLPSMRTNRDSFQSELELGLDSQLNDNEKQELDKLLKDIEKLNKEHTNICKKRNEYSTEKSRTESVLDENLKQRKDELEFSLIDSKILQNETIVENGSFDCDLIDIKIDSLRKQLEEKNNKIDKMMAQKNDQKTLLDDLKIAEDLQLDIINSESKKSRKIIIKLESIKQKTYECMNKLKTMGTIPSDENTNYHNLSLTNKYKKLQKCNHRLSQLTNVNQKALDQLNAIQEKVKLLTAEKNQLNCGYTSIGQLIENLEHQKYEAIQITYRQVSQFFSKIFKELVPEGKAFLDMIYGDNGSTISESRQQTQDSQSSGGIASLAEIPIGQRIDNFIGVKIQVAFTGTAVIKEMSQLSGGQKTIVALAFIFAIQSCDPAPFYLFDEVDHALDPQYRKAVADIIKKMSKNSQFISTTFRPELLECGHKFFGVKFRNGISEIGEITKQMAVDFVNSDETIEREHQRKRRSVHFEGGDGK